VHGGTLWEGQYPVVSTSTSMSNPMVASIVTGSGRFLDRAVLLYCFHLSRVSRLIRMSLNIPSSLEVNWYPHSALSRLTMSFSASSLTDRPASRRLARCCL
jgi:hypothetical protein